MLKMGCKDTKQLNIVSVTSGVEQYGESGNNLVARVQVVVRLHDEMLVNFACDFLAVKCRNSSLSPFPMQPDTLYELALVEVNWEAHGKVSYTKEGKGGFCDVTFVFSKFGDRYCDITGMLEKLQDEANAQILGMDACLDKLVPGLRVMNLYMKLREARNEA